VTEDVCCGLSCRPTSAQLSFYRCLSYCCILVLLSLHVLCCHFAYFSATEIFGPSLLWPNGWMDEAGTWHGDRPQPRRLCVRWGPSPLPQKGRSSTQFSVHVYCGQTAAWIKIPLGTEVGLGLRNIVFDVGPAIPRKRAHPCTQFWPVSIVAKWLDG